MSDGSYQVEVYAYPVHELVDGVWVEIESTSQNARSDVSPSSEQTNILDNFVWKDHGVQSSTGLRLYIGSRSGYTARTYIQFATMPTIPAGSTITAATMKLTMVSGTSLAYTANAYQVTGDEWDPTTIQWTNKPAADVLLESNISNNDRTKYEFSILTAARHCYDGDPTGQNENYGIMLRYYDETLTGYYNSVYSGDVVDTNSRPKLTISYTPPNDEVSVLEGYIKQLTVPDTTETITWTSSDTAVATVDSAGKVTGVKAGKVTITASAGGAELQTYTVYVRIENGIYRIDNRDTNFYLAANSGALENATTLLRSSTTDELPMLRQLWRVTYLQAGYYVIRPMHNQNMALHAKNGVSDVTTIGYNNTLSGVPAENRWTIEYLNGGYVFKCQGDSAQALRSNDTSPYTHVFTGEYASTSQYFRWYFEAGPYIEPRVLLLDIQTGETVNEISRAIAQGQTVTPGDLGLAASFVCADYDSHDVWWVSSVSSVVSIDSETGKMTAVENGSSVVKAEGRFNNTPYSKQFTVIVASVPSDTYFIKSSAAELYLQVTNSDSLNNYGTPGAPMVQWKYTGEDYQKWDITLLNDGYYSIISAQSGLSLSVPSDQSTNVDVTLVQEAYNGYDRQKWKITLTEDYQYVIKAKSSESASTDMAMAVGYSATNVSQGVDIQQRAYVADGDLRDEWILCAEIVDIGMSTDDCVGDCPHDDLGSYTYARKFYDSLIGDPSGPYTKTHHYNNGSVQTASPADFAEYGAISNDIDFMIYIGHGHSAHNSGGNHLHYDCGLFGETHIYNEETETYSRCNANGNVYSKGMQFGSENSDLRWVWLYTCNFLHAKEDNADNDSNTTNDNDFVTNADLVSMMDGAHLVMGHASRATLCSAMAQQFGIYLRAGMPVYDAFFKAGATGEASVETLNHYQKILYVPQARYETIYSPFEYYDPNTVGVEIAKRCIHDPY